MIKQVLGMLWDMEGELDKAAAKSYSSYDYDPEPLYYHTFQRWIKERLNVDLQKLANRVHQLEYETQKQAEEIRLLQERLGATSKQDSESPV